MGYSEGMVAFKAGDYERASHEFVSATEIDEHNHKAWNALGICLSKTGELESAATCFENAIELDPGNAIYKKNQERNDTKRGVEPDLELDDEPLPTKSSIPGKKPSIVGNPAVSGYQRNWWQIPLYFVPIVCAIINPVFGFLVVIGCAWYIKYDADSLNAGSNPNGSAWGKLKGWEWMLLLVFFWILLPIYSWKREQVYEENYEFSSSGQTTSGSLSLVKLGVGVLAFLFLCMVVSAFVFGMAGNVNQTKNIAIVTENSQDITPVVNSAPVSTTSIIPTAEPTPDRVTAGQKNAAKKAKSYLEFTAFSRSGLIKQLEYEKFTPADAEYGVDQSGADWNEQAGKKAKSYLDLSSFSRDGLIKQLVFEKFTQSQAEYGATAAGY